MDDDQTDVKPAAGEETSESTSSIDEQKTAEETQEEATTVEPTGKQEEEKTEVESEESKKGASSRIRELNHKAKTAEEKARIAEEKSKSLESKLAELTGSGEQSAKQEQYTPQIQEGSEVSPEQYKQDVLKTAETLVTLKLKQSDSINRINREASEVMTAFPQLDPESDSYDQELSESVTEATLAYVKSDPYGASPKKFVEKLMKPYQRAVDKEVGKVSENIARQVTQTALRPTSTPTKGEKSDSELSPEELEAKYGIVY